MNPTRDKMEELETLMFSLADEIRDLYCSVNKHCGLVWPIDPFGQQFMAVISPHLKNIEAILVRRIVLIALTMDHRDDLSN